MAAKTVIQPVDLVLHKGQVLGTGGSGQVYKGTLRDKSGKRTVAVKVLDGSPATKDPPREFLLLKKALDKCPYVCRPLGYCVKNGQVCLVLHLYEKSLKKYIEERNGRSKGALHIRETVSIAKQLAEAVRMLHKNARIAHFDIKPDNVLLDASGSCYLCDFSIAHEVPGNASSIPLPHDAYGSTNYMSPEQVVNKPGGIGFAADAWGLSATILELATGSPPYPDLPVMRVLNMLMNGTVPTVPANLEPRLAHIISRSFVISPITRQDVLAMRHALSSLNELLRIESGGTPSVPNAVLQSAEILPTPTTSSAQSAPSLPSVSPTPSVTGPARTPSPSPSAPSAVALPSVTAPSAPTSAPSNVAATKSNIPSAPRNSVAAASQSAPAAEVDLLALDHLAIGPVGHPNGAATVLTNGTARTHVTGTTSAASTPPLSPVPSGDAEPVVITAGANGCLGVKSLFRSCTRLLANPNDAKQMTGVVTVPRAGGPGLREAVSVSADGKLSWWDLCHGRVSGMASLATADVPPGVVGRSVAANDRFVAVGTDRAALLVWQFPNGGSSWVDANEGRAPVDQAPPRCTAVTHVKSDIGRPAVTSSESNRIYDLSLQPRWEEDPGGRWVAAASSLGNLILWDTTTWKEMFCAKATKGSMYSCNAMPGSNMVAVACQSPQLVQIWDCRQAPTNIAAVMTCDLPPHGHGHGHGPEDADAIYCVAHVPNAPGASGIPSQLLLGSKRGRLYLWDLRFTGALWTVAQLADKVLGCAASACGRRVVAASRSGQVAMLDWTKPLKGIQATQAAHPYVSQWKCSNPMYLWPRLEKGILRVACGNVLPGPLLSDSPPFVAEYGNGTTG